MKPEAPAMMQNPQYQTAIALHQAGKLPEAACIYRDLLNAFPDDIQLLTMLGTINLQIGNFEAGTRFLEQSVKIDPQQPLAWFYLGIGFMRLKLYDAALDSYERAIAIKPDFADAYCNRANTFLELKRFDEALAGYDSAISIKPDFTLAYYNRGNALRELQHFGAALSSYESAMALKPDFAEVFCNCGIVLKELKRFEEALTSYDRAITLKADYAEAYFNRGNALNALNRFDEALSCYDKAIDLNPGFAAAYNSRGIALKALKRFEAAMSSYQTAIALKPDYAEAYCNLGRELYELNRYAESLVNCEQAIALNPECSEPYNIRGLVRQELREYQSALADFDQAIALQADYTDAIWHKSQLKLLTGDYPEGWRLYESRWKIIHEDHTANFSQPLWLGDQAITGKTLLITAEQGLGDFIQICRYIPMLENLAGEVILEVPAALAALIGTLNGRFRIVEQGRTLPKFDYYCPIMSLPLAFKTTLETIPATVPYLYADTDKCKTWQERLGKKTGTRIGLAWSGSTAHKNDHNRSIPLQQLGPLLNVPMEFHCLQNQFRDEDAKWLSRFKQINTHQAEILDFSDTAALLNQMDLVISVDTSVAHLAGAMAKPVWILLPNKPDFRWMLDRSDNPWYSSATLFRHPASGNWSGVISEVAQKLAATGIQSAGFC